VSNNNQQLDQTARVAGLVGQIGCVTGFAAIIIIAVAFLFGRLLDNWLGTDGVFTVLFLLGSFPITLFVIVRISLMALKRVQTAPTESSPTESTPTTPAQAAEPALQPTTEEDSPE
jgi:ABC-type multidrug transport system permease subunit